MQPSKKLLRYCNLTSLSITCTTITTAAARKYQLILIIIKVIAGLFTALYSPLKINNINRQQLKILTEVWIHWILSTTLLTQTNSLYSKGISRSLKKSTSILVLNLLKNKKKLINLQAVIREHSKVIFLDRSNLRWTCTSNKT